MVRNPVVWFEIYVQNMARAQKFYETVLKIQLQKMDMPPSIMPDIKEMLFFPSEMNLPGATGALVKMKGVPSTGGGTMVYFASDDCAVEESRVKAAGGAIRQGKMSIGQYGFIALCADTEGNMFGIHSIK